MERLMFYDVSTEYIDYLQETETQKRGFTRVPNMVYDKSRKQKFLCGVVLDVNNKKYFAPITSYKKKQPDNFLIKITDNDMVEKISSSVRFNYMIPIPKNRYKLKDLDNETDKSYKEFVLKELLFCQKHTSTIMNRARRTYERVVKNLDAGLVFNACDFELLEKACEKYNTNWIGRLVGRIKNLLNQKRKNT